MAALLALCCSLAQAGHHLNGTWKFNVTLGDGQGGVATIELTAQPDGTLAGSYSGAAGEAPVTGSVEGTSVRFSFDSPAAGTVTYDGTYDQGVLSGSCNYGLAGAGTFSGTRE